MPYKIPEEKILEIKEATDIVELISDYLTLKKRGKNLFGICPFHNEKTPSFSVDPVSQMYHCFGCHKGGNVITFIMDIEKMSFVEAVEVLAERAGITIKKSSISEKLLKEKEALHFANKFAAELYYKNLMSESGKIALKYLKERDYDEAIIRTFGLGYSLNLWDGLIKTAQQHSINLEILYKAGLIIKKEGGGYYDRFRGRLMIPIINLSRKVIGFGGRILEKSEAVPKYINSPETTIYQKSHSLYGLFRTRDEIRDFDQAIFVEGYTDLISLYKFGIKNVVATLGTSLTVGQAQLIKRYTNNVILIYDGDIAGSTATMRNADIFLNEGLDVKIVALPEDHDPDSYVKKYGSQKLMKFVSDAESIIQFKIKILSKRYNIRNMNERTKVIQLILESVLNIKNSIKQDIALKEIAEFFGVEDSSLRKQLIYSRKIEYSEDKDRYEQRKMETSLQSNKYQVAEENLIKLIILDNKLVEPVFTHVKLSEITSESVRYIMEVIYNLHSKKEQINSVTVTKTISDPEISSFLSHLLSKQFNENDNLHTELNDSVIIIKRRILEQEKHEITKKISQYEKSGNDIGDLNVQYINLQKMIKQLESKNFISSEENT